MPEGLNDNLEEGEICDDNEEFNIEQSNITKSSDVVIRERTNLTTECFQSLNHANNKSLHSNNSEIPYQSTVFPALNNDLENELENFHNYEVDDGKFFMNQRMMDEDQSDDESKVSNFQGIMEFFFIEYEYNRIFGY